MVSRMLKRNGWNRKEARRQSLRTSEPLRLGYLKDIARFNAEDLVFLDKLIFNKKTGWRYRAYALIGEVA